MKRNVFLITLLTVLGWGFITYADYLEETKSDDALLPIAIFVVPVILVCSYILVEGSWTRSHTPKVKRHLVFCIMWLIENGLIYCLWEFLSARGKWMVTQDVNDWYHILNGLEYGMYFLVSGIGGAVLLLVVGLFSKITVRNGGDHKDNDTGEKQ